METQKVWWRTTVITACPHESSGHSFLTLIVSFVFQRRNTYYNPLSMKYTNWSWRWDKWTSLKYFHWLSIVYFFICFPLKKHKTVHNILPRTLADTHPTPADPQLLSYLCLLVLLCHVYPAMPPFVFIPVFFKFSTFTKVIKVQYG